jgi:hypothetical protein
VPNPPARINAFKEFHRFKPQTYIQSPVNINDFVKKGEVLEGYAS